MKTKMAIAGTCGLGMLLAGAAASAGLKDTNVEDYVSISGGTAEGVMSSVRLSPDSTQYIGCWVWITNATAGLAHVSCEAEDSANHTLYCDTTAAPYLQAAASINSDSWIWFSADANGNCTGLMVDTESNYSPKT